ncbi:MAG: riboflavin synthase [Saprospirales bacterium]|jgi:riboflavin synthase|nr:riboflavin synthase [Saprospirales bacterium]
MFTGIIEALGAVRKIEKDRSNIHFTLASPISSELKVDQSVSHDGACLTVVERGSLDGTAVHTVTAVEETLRRTNLGAWRIGTLVNLERCLPIGGRLDGHLVQGHVDAVAHCVEVLETGGSWRFAFRYRPSPGHLLVDKGSVCLNGVSLTVVEPQDDLFSVAIIPFTWEHTNFRNIAVGDAVNTEFDLIGKYISRYLALYK